MAVLSKVSMVSRRLLKSANVSVCCFSFCFFRCSKSSRFSSMLPLEISISLRGSMKPVLAKNFLSRFLYPLYNFAMPCCCFVVLFFLLFQSKNPCFLGCFFYYHHHHTTTTTQ